jgi:hypothetical protein
LKPFDLAGFKRHHAVETQPQTAGEMPLPAGAVTDNADIDSPLCEGRYLAIVDTETIGVVVGGPDWHYRKRNFGTAGIEDTVDHFMHSPVPTGRGYKAETGIGCLHRQVFGMSRLLGWPEHRPLSQLVSQFG